MVVYNEEWNIGIVVNLSTTIVPEGTRGKAKILGM
jgi:hypothetical protein